MDDLKGYLDQEKAKLQIRFEKSVTDLEKSLAVLERKILKKHTYSKKSDLKPQLELKQKQLQVEKARAAAKKFHEFEFLIFGEVQCAECFTWHGIHSNLRKEKFALGVTILTCPKCRRDLKLPPHFR